MKLLHFKSTVIYPSVQRFFSKLIAAIIFSAGFAAIGDAAVAADEPTKITYEDHIKPIFREHCTACHNSNSKESGLALDTYQGVITGGSGGEVVAAGDVDASRLFKLAAHKEQPYMPPKQDMIQQAKVDLLKVWIEQGLPENSGSAIQKPKANASALGMVSTGRPEGAPPMPVALIKQTPFYTQRAATISALSASPWSPLVAVGGQKQVSFYHSESGRLQGIIPFPEGEPQSITFSRDGRLTLIAGGRHSVSGCAALYEVATGNRIALVGDELDIVFSADISDDNQLVALAGPQKIVRVFDTLTGKLKYEQKKHTDWIYCVRFSPDGLLLATADRASGLVVWEAQSGRLFQELPGHKGEIRSIAWRPDSQALISGSLDGTLKMWDMNEGKLLKSWDAHSGGVAAIAICNDGTMVSTGRDNKVKVWDASGNAAGEMPALVEAGYEVAITVDGKQIVAGDWAGNVRMWQRATPVNEKMLPANPIPLEHSLAAVQQQLNQAKATAQAAQAELLTHQSQHAAAQRMLTEFQSEIETVTAELKSAEEQSTQLEVQNLTAKKAVVEQKVESATNALKSSNEAIAAAQLKVDASNSLVAPLQIQFDEVQADISRFAALPFELTARKASIEQAIADAESKISPAEAVESVAKAQLDVVNGEIAKLEQQLAALQATIAAEQVKRRMVQSEATGKQKAVDAIRSQIQQSEADLSSTIIQQQLFEKAFGKK